MSSTAVARKRKKQARIKYRRMRESDLLDAERIVVRALNHLRKEVNLEPIKTRITAPWPIQVHFLKSDPDGHFVALNERNRIVGYASSIVREHEWYLAMLFVLPSYQTSGVGGKLLEKALKYGEKMNCTRHALATFSYNPQAIAVYTRRGMPPQAVTLMMSRKRSAFRNVKPELQLKVRTVENEKKVNRFNRLDRKIRGVARPEEHFFWLSDPDHHLLEFRDGRKFAGYAVINNKGQVGPIAAAKPVYLESMVAYCINSELLSDAEVIKLFAHGEQSGVLELLLRSGFRIVESTLVMASERFSDPTCYLPGNLAHY